MDTPPVESNSQDISRYPCEKCGAQLNFEPGTTALRCPYCGHVTPIAPPTTVVEELDIHAYFDQANLNLEEEHSKIVHCNQCAAEFSILPTEVTQSCPFCGSNVVVETPPQNRIMPNGVMAFRIPSKEARAKVGDWLGSRFWAPNDLKKLALKEGQLAGMYVPFWTYDSDTTTDYTGQRGEYYYVTETYTDYENGRPVTRTRQVRHTRWYPASGTVFVQFDDLLVLGSSVIPEQYSRRLQTWDLPAIVPYDPKYLVGFRTLRYDRDLANGWAVAQDMMEPEINMAIRHDIGGDEQVINSKTTAYSEVTFKHVLLPVWVGGYRYRGKSFRFLVNGQTGEIQGEAPISAWKVALAVLLGLIIIGIIAYFADKNKNSESSGSSWQIERSY